MGFKLSIGVNVYNELFVDQASVNVRVMMRGRDQTLASGPTGDDGKFFTEIDLSSDDADSPSEVYVYCSKAGMQLTASILDSAGLPFYAGQDQVKTYLYDGNAMMIGGTAVSAPLPPP